MYWISMLPSLGKTGPGEVYDEFYDQYVYAYNDNSFQLLLYGVLTIFLIVAFIGAWRMNIKQHTVTNFLASAAKRSINFLMTQSLWWTRTSTRHFLLFL